jgi:hypothetical protein
MEGESELSYKDDELSYMIENGRDSRPYDFELSSHSKYKIISQNSNIRNVLKTESA